ncbi:spermidine hydroxycinnamoyl transferase [Pistacia vera]|uniref:spermidine hydroxycinnamoyl transferase n=1 Tax=Pistacia vera TaxID=55513 RepID=UPI001263525D|nr:spermidine hydroxycinnamoyl transferase [Pistacia vera]
MAGQHGEGTPVSNLQIESVQTVTPFKETDPRQRRQVLVTDPVGSGIFRRCFNILLYYKKVVEDESGWIVAGWMKESIARALVHQPLLSGRLRRGEDGHAGLELVSNDSGLRLIEAGIPMTLSEFLDKKSRDDEAELVFWKDIDEQNPQFSPLFYVQVTNFECGGYSVGMSCNILLADLLITDNFLKKWVNIHNEMLSKVDAIETPIFYLPTLKKTSGSPSIPIIRSDQTKNCGKTMIFKITDENINLENESGKTLMLVCVKETENEVGSKLASKYPVFLKEPFNTIKIETCSRLENEMVPWELDVRNQVRGESWDDLGANEIVIHKGNKPTRVSYWMGSVMDGIVMALTSTEGEEANSGPNIIVSVPWN